MDEAPELLAQNLNCWFTKEPAQRMLRTLDGTARAYLSNRYRESTTFFMPFRAMPWAAHSYKNFLPAGLANGWQEVLFYMF